MISFYAKVLAGLFLVVVVYLALALGAAHLMDRVLGADSPSPKIIKDESGCVSVLFPDAEGELAVAPLPDRDQPDHCREGVRL